MRRRYANGGIAEKAGLTRGTLYRNFAHRQAMYEAVLQVTLR
ncbi:MAG: TetR family transcriptional regulator [Pseudorhodobacter sp.]|nr:TetR family transcriptional regulator [Pseudorhodobacter sp.]